MLAIRETFELARPQQFLLSGRRALHLVDVENLAGSATVSRTDAIRLHQAYAHVARYGVSDHVVLATSHHSALSAWLGWPPTSRRLVRSGPHGADVALLEVIRRESVATRFDHVVIGSGDGIFAFEAARLQSAGVNVTVVTRRGALSRQLRLAVRDVRYIDSRIKPILTVLQGGVRTS